MRLTMYRPHTELGVGWRLGAAVPGFMLDLHAAAAVYGHQFPSRPSAALPASILELLRAGDHAMMQVQRVHEWASARQDTGFGRHPFCRLSECTSDAPLRPGKLITLARNYCEHVAEHGLTHSGKVPSASIKASSSLIGPYDDIVRPQVERKLDYETELAIVIGRRCKNVPQAHAYDVVAGYTILSDIVAREVLRIERDAGNQFLGKMFDSFGPFGPWIVTKDEILDPMNLTIMTRVNDEIRQCSNTSRMIWSIPQLIAYFSQATLEPGDVISTGTPAGVAAGRKPQETSWYLSPGDVVESEVEHVGLLRNRVVEDAAPGVSWNWATE